MAQGTGGHNSHAREHIWAHSYQNVLGQGSRDKCFSVSAPKSASVGADEAVLGGQEAKGSLEGSCPFSAPAAPHGTAGEEERRGAAPPEGIQSSWQLMIRSSLKMQHCPKIQQSSAPKFALLTPKALSCRKFLGELCPFPWSCSL